MTDQTDGSETPVHQIVITPNQSLSALGWLGCYCGGLAVSLAIALALAWFGYWPILAFAVAEWLGIGVCLWAVRRGGRYREVITLTESVIRVERRHLERLESMSFQRHWASVEQQGSGSWHPSRLVIKSHGMACEVGRCLTETERRALAARLDKVIGPVNQTPELI